MTKNPANSCISSLSTCRETADRVIRQVQKVKKGMKHPTKVLIVTVCAFIEKYFNLVLMTCVLSRLILLAHCLERPSPSCLNRGCEASARVNLQLYTCLKTVMTALMTQTRFQTRKKITEILLVGCINSSCTHLPIVGVH